MTVAALPKSEEPPPPPVAPEPVAEPVSEPSSELSLAPADRRKDEDPESDSVRSLPPSMIKSYGIWDSTFPGPAAFGAGAISIGRAQFATRGAQRRFSNHPLDGSFVKEQIDCHVKTATQQRLAIQIVRHQLGYLSGSPGSGRRSATLVALSARHEPDRITQLWLSGSQPLHSYFGEPELLRPGYGHIVKVEDLMDVDPSELAQLCALARENDSSVVLIGTRGLRDSKLAEYLAEHDPPSAQSVFLAWLDRRLRDRGVCVGGCRACEGECLQRYVDECASEYASNLSVSTMTEAVGFADSFAEKVPHGDEAVYLLADWRELHATAVKLLNAGSPPDGSLASTGYAVLRSISGPPASPSRCSTVIR